MRRRSRRRARRSRVVEAVRRPGARGARRRRHSPATRDLRIAEARVAEARALFSEQRLDYAPAVTTHAGFSRQDSPVPQAGSVLRGELRVYDIGFDAAWEVDLFGRVRRSNEAARADAEAAEAAAATAQVRLTAEVARNISSCAARSGGSTWRARNPENQREALEAHAVCASNRRRGTELDVASATARLAETDALVPPLDGGREARRVPARGAARRTARRTRRPRSRRRNRTRASHELRIGDAAELLRRRPDIRSPSASSRHRRRASASQSQTCSRDP